MPCAFASPCPREADRPWGPRWATRRAAPRPAGLGARPGPPPPEPAASRAAHHHGVHADQLVRGSDPVPRSAGHRAARLVPVLPYRAAAPGRGPACDLSADVRERLLLALPAVLHLPDRAAGRAAGMVGLRPVRRRRGR